MSFVFGIYRNLRHSSKHHKGAHSDSEVHGGDIIAVAFFSEASPNVQWALTRRDEVGQKHQAFAAMMRNLLHGQILVAA